MSTERKSAKPLADAAPSVEDERDESPEEQEFLSAGQAADIKVYGSAIDPVTGKQITK